MVTIWICVALTAIASFAIKAAGPALLGNRPLPPRAGSVFALLPPALLAGLVVSDILGSNWSSANAPLALGVLTAAVVRMTGLPTPACVVAAVVVTAVTHAVL
jgi:branched-subunit amino acid transport protein